MNVPYNEINLEDAAKRIGVGYTTVAGWCRNHLINFVDLSEGTAKPRYMLLDKEVERLKSEKKKYGRFFIRNYDKNWDVQAKNEVLEHEKNTNVYPPLRSFRGIAA